MRKKHYKIQEVIKRRQIILVQVVKEERGNKGAALTTYLSLAGRYCVLMPNTPRGGGISRKITNAADRKRLKSAAQGLELPEGMGLIIRTAGENRTKLEIRRDYEYLLRLWDTIREKTLSSNAPACVYEEGDLIKRVIRDLYNKDVQDVVVEGEARLPQRQGLHAHADAEPCQASSTSTRTRCRCSSACISKPQLDAMFSPTVTLKSGGYIVINQTEALVSIDVNSGRATREHSIEETARKTNLEAADEVGRQLRLRDLAGLIVIDFIDMEEGRNDREVEKRLRDAVKNDRARVQIGKISPVRPDGNVAPAPARRRGGRLHRHLPALRRRRASCARWNPPRCACCAAWKKKARRTAPPPSRCKIANDVAIYILEPEAPRTGAHRNRIRHGDFLRAQGRPAGRHFRAGTHPEPRSGRAAAQFTPSASRPALCPPTSPSRTMSKKSTRKKKSIEADSAPRRRRRR